MHNVCTLFNKLLNKYCLNNFVNIKIQFMPFVIATYKIPIHKMLQNFQQFNRILQNRRRGYNYSKALDSRQQNSKQTDCTYVHLHNYRVYSSLQHYTLVCLSCHEHNRCNPIPNFQELNDKKNTDEHL